MTRNSGSHPEIHVEGLLGEEAVRARRPMVVLSGIALAVGTGLVELDAISAAGVSVRLADNALPLIFGISTLYLLCSFLAHSFADWQRFRARVAAGELSEASEVHEAIMRRFEQVDRHRTLRSEAEALTRDKKEQLQHQLEKLLAERERMAALTEALGYAGEHGSRFTQHAHEHRMLRGDLAALQQRIQVIEADMEKLETGTVPEDVSKDGIEFRHYIEQVEAATSRLRELGRSSGLAAGRRLRITFEFFVPAALAVIALLSLLLDGKSV
ncbi:MAG: hypothetical protein K0U98_28485 [Deltaproteobacteria bacterium]|nr:hypothetical protein [Deltaproteobacteria bacterium]